ncbi:hypothetical protein EDI_236940 [Entamoeba dispar SAW760]|uniref:Uncharacterized protein n=1 Tax=Entamoeba dispar (strain ATCC PRA-260 / SAW760) TaxID=370354 RepID=B0EU61_ENTDS|nr:uncharacterized protein EDI_236940 [Entamoeba dispar SAW760]EDR21940.1 hypothetical protein EDI_236940 [Entamoeba dispar SAW760]|eukprot:EDR21940.1 hypothetical protein EDI_236940 [Entamoeba dispar SAW760]
MDPTNFLIQYNEFIEDIKENIEMIKVLDDRIKDRKQILLMNNDEKVAEIERLRKKVASYEKEQRKTEKENEKIEDMTPEEIKAKYIKQKVLLGKCRVAVEYFKTGRDQALQEVDKLKKQIEEKTDSFKNTIVCDVKKEIEDMRSFQEIQSNNHLKNLKILEDQSKLYHAYWQQTKTDFSDFKKESEDKIKKLSDINENLSRGIKERDEKIKDLNSIIENLNHVDTYPKSTTPSIISEESKEIEQQKTVEIKETTQPLISQPATIPLEGYSSTNKEDNKGVIIKKDNLIVDQQKSLSQTFPKSIEVKDTKEGLQTEIQQEEVAKENVMDQISKLEEIKQTNKTNDKSIETKKAVLAKGLAYLIHAQSDN